MQSNITKIHAWVQGILTMAYVCLCAQGIRTIILLRDLSLAELIHIQAPVVSYSCGENLGRNKMILINCDRSVLVVALVITKKPDYNSPFLKTIDLTPYTKFLIT